MVPSAYLRVFQPLEAFQPEEQALWERYIIEGHRSRAAHRRYAQRLTSGRLGFLTPTEGDHADVKVLERTYYVCPWRTRLRVLAGMLSFRDASPFEGAEEFLPASEARKAGRELNRLRRKNPGVVSFIHESPWHVPIRWFVLFDDEERRLRETPSHGWRLTYLTSVRKARRRAEQVFPVLRKTDLGPIADMIWELHEWLENFDGRSLLELDYDGLCEVFTWDELDDDRSARDLHEALAALSAEDYSRSADVYQGVLGRWAEVRNREALN